MNTLHSPAPSAADVSVHCSHGAAVATFIDPVCGMTVQPQSPHHAVHEGREYRFCAASCRAKFIADPARWLEPRDAAPVAAPPGATYICPMHPEIIRDQPGSCPLCGMALEPVMPALDEGENPELVDFRRRFLWTLPLSLLVFVVAMFGDAAGLMTPAARSLLELALTAPVVLWAGWPFFQRWTQSIANRSPNMWTLIGTGVGAAFIYSVVATVAPGLFPDSFRVHGRVAVYFEAAAIIVSLTLLGQILELKARSSTSAALKALLGLAPKTARRLRDDGTEEDIPLAHVHVGDRAARAPGGKGAGGRRSARGALQRRRIDADRRADAGRKGAGSQGHRRHPERRAARWSCVPSRWDPPRCSHRSCSWSRRRSAPAHRCSASPTR